MLIARQKLNHDLFDRRFNVYVAVRDYIIAVLNREGGSHDEARGYHLATIPAPFLFDEELAVYIRQVEKRGTEVRTFKEAADKAISEERRQEYMQKFRDAHMWFGQEYDRFTERFQGSLNLSRLKPFPIKEIVPLAKLAELKTKAVRRLREENDVR